MALAQLACRAEIPRQETEVEKTRDCLQYPSIKAGLALREAGPVPLHSAEQRLRAFPTGSGTGEGVLRTDCSCTVSKGAGFV